MATLLFISFLFQRYKDKLDREKNSDNYDAIQKYLINDSSLAKAKKPILFIPINFEYNSRNWISFGSRSSFELNQPYLYLTVKSIIKNCDESFHIVIIDDDSFKKLLPSWKIQLNKLSSPLLDYFRVLGLAKLLKKYGGMIVPPSFLCFRDLIDLYETRTAGNKMFVVENVNRNITSTTNEFGADINFCGAAKDCKVLDDMIDFMQRTISNDNTSQNEFLGEFNRWCELRIKHRQINLIDGKLIGTKTMDETPILVDDLLSNNYLDLYSKAYGIYIPAQEILNRNKFEWYARLSVTQVLESRVIISKYILLANTPDKTTGVIEPLENKPSWIGYWKIPSGFWLWGLKPEPGATHIRKQTMNKKA